MTPYYADGQITIYNADCREALAELGPESADCCITSPPYFGLRDYSTAKWEGGDSGCDHAQEAPRWNGPKQTRAQVSGHASRAESHGRKTCGKCGAQRVDRQIGLEPSPDAYVAELVDVFRAVWRVLKPEGTLWINLGDSFANDGKWGGHTGGKHAAALHCSPIGRNKRYTGLKPKDLIGIPWRVAFALQADGWWLRSDIVWAKPNPMPESVRDRPTRSHEYIFLLSKSERYYYDADAIAEPAVSKSVKKFHDGGRDKQRGHGRRHAGFNGRYAERLARDGKPETRNARDVWRIAPGGNDEEHYAQFPPELARRCILAGCPTGGVVLDPFMGVGTTAQEAVRLGCRAVGIELNDGYCALAVRRIGQGVIQFTESEVMA